jgi:hypothetical protein
LPRTSGASRGRQALTGSRHHIGIRDQDRELSPAAFYYSRSRRGREPCGRGRRSKAGRLDRRGCESARRGGSAACRPRRLPRSKPRCGPAAWISRRSAMRTSHCDPRASAGPAVSRGARIGSAQRFPKARRLTPEDIFPPGGRSARCSGACGPVPLRMTPPLSPIVMPPWQKRTRSICCV